MASLVTVTLLHSERVKVLEQAPSNLAYTMPKVKLTPTCLPHSTFGVRCSSLPLVVKLVTWYATTHVYLRPWSFAVQECVIVFSVVCGLGCLKRIFRAFYGAVQGLALMWWRMQRRCGASCGCQTHFCMPRVRGVDVSSSRLELPVAGEEEEGPGLFCDSNCSAASCTQENL